MPADLARVASRLLTFHGWRIEAKSRVMVIAWEIIRRKHERRIVMLETVIMMLLHVRGFALLAPICLILPDPQCAGSLKCHVKKKEREEWVVGEKEKRGKDKYTIVAERFVSLRLREEMQRCRNRPGMARANSRSGREAVCRLVP